MKANLCLLVCACGFASAAGAEFAADEFQAVTLSSPVVVAANESTPDRPVSVAIGGKLSSDETNPYAAGSQQLAQFQLPAPTADGQTPAAPLIQRIPFQYSIGTESEIFYARDRDLNNRVRDNSLIMRPQVKGFFVYRPTDWLSTTVELILDKDIPVNEQQTIVLPSGEVQVAQRRHPSLLFNQAFVTIKGVTDPFELNFGRRNYEDARHWLYDSSLDIASVTFKRGRFRVEAFVGREVLWDMDLLRAETKNRINTHVVNAEYRGIEDLTLSAFMIERDDRARVEGRPLMLGMSAIGAPSDRFSYWTQLAVLRGRDQTSKQYAAHAVDIGGTYRFPTMPLSPSITLGYAYGSGDDNPNDSKNHEFRQTGLQSNEARFSGVSNFKVYGEALDPELSNLRIVTAGIGFRPKSNVFVDLVYHRYRLNKLADSIRGSPVTAVMNQDDTQLSKKVGSALDIVVGIRNLFGVRRLGVDLRAGLFFPGQAHRIEERSIDPLTGDEKISFRKANKGVGFIVKFWY
jgi:alginate production protein